MEVILLTSFRTKYEPIKVHTEPGSAFAATYKLKYGEDGTADLVIVGKVNVDEKIQSYRDSCDIQVLLERFANGDVTALSKSPSFYADLSDMPTNLAGYLQLIHDAEKAFFSLDPDVRSRFNNSPDQFFAAIGSDQFYKLLGINTNPGSVSEKVEEVAEEVKE